MRALLIAPVLLVLGVWLVYANLLPGRMLPVEDARIAEAQDRLRAALAQEITWHAPRMKLRDLPDVFQEQLGVPIKIDEKPVTDAAIDLDQDVLAEVSKRPADAVLAKLLEARGCGWTIERDYILITTTEQVMLRLGSRVYPVRDLVLCRDEKGDAVEDPDSLIEGIQAGVLPESWKDNGTGEGTIVYLPVAGAIIVSQTEAVHAEVGRTIDALRRARAQQRELPPLKQPTAVPGPKQQPYVGSIVPVVG